MRQEDEGEDDSKVPEDLEFILARLVLRRLRGGWVSLVVTARTLLALWRRSDDRRSTENAEVTRRPTESAGPDGRGPNSGS